tara:strand:- start:9931 stop:10185 length:255 start_codon:yes stop_codon:yes gene_type:complete
MIKIYTSKECDYCKELQEKLRVLNIEFTNVDIDDDSNREHATKLFEFVGEPVIPIIICEMHLLAPNRSFQTIDQAIVLIKSLIE